MALASDSESDAAAPEAAKVNTARRGKSRVPGHAFGLAAAKADFRRREKEEVEAEFERDLSKRASRKSKKLEGDTTTKALSADRLDAQSLKVRTLEKCEKVLEVAQKAKNLKKEFVRDLKESAVSIREAVESFSDRTESEENRRLRRDNINMRNELEAIKLEVVAIRRDFAQAKARPSVPAENGEIIVMDQVVQESNEDLKRWLMISVGEMMNARLAGLEDRLLPAKKIRPALAADKRVVVASGSMDRPESPILVRSTPAPHKAGYAPAVPTNAQVQTTAPAEESWATVVRKGRKKKAAAAAKPAAPTAAAERTHETAYKGTFSGTVAKKVAPAGKATRSVTKAKAVKIASPPKTAAVVIKLQPEAEAEGATYKEVITRARERVALPELGIDGLSIRQTATGARIIEIPGSESESKADLLVGKLAVALAGVANVYRPTKNAEIRIKGLDDSTTKVEVIAAVAEKGGCSADQIRAGEIRTERQDGGSIYMSLPVAAAMTLSNAGRLLVGWSSARVTLLEARPMRCFKCMGLGHTAALCSSSVVRGTLCYRCGKEGHKSDKCSSAPRCAVCTDARKKADHVMGGANCKPPSSKGKNSRSQLAGGNLMDH